MGVCSPKGITSISAGERSSNGGAFTGTSRCWILPKSPLEEEHHSQHAHAGGGMKEERRHNDGFPLNKTSERIPGSLTRTTGGAETEANQEPAEEPAEEPREEPLGVQLKEAVLAIKAKQVEKDMPKR